MIPEDSKAETTQLEAQRLAVLDLGTNTFHLLIADIASGKPMLVFGETIPVKLGEGGLSNGFISQAAFDRGIQAIRTFKQKIDQFGVKNIRSAATSALRSSSNGAEFIQKVKAETDLDLVIIDGEREAELIYKGVRAATDLDVCSLIVDIGGGSVECIICDKHQIFWKKSYPVGAARLMEKFHHTDPISASEILALNDFFRHTFKDLAEQLAVYKPKVMVGSAGAFETYALFQANATKLSFENPSVAIDLPNYRNTSTFLLNSTHQEREQRSEIIPVRVDMIVTATLLTNYLLGLSEIEILMLSAYSLKEGLLFDKFN